jgi:hypothetical protein
MEGIEKPHMDKYKEITNDWNYDSKCMVTSALVSDLPLVPVAQSVHTCMFLHCAYA